MVGDPVRLRQVILNLIGNAIKFTEKGEVVLRVELDAQEAAAQEAHAMSLHFAISDTGIGIPLEKPALIFEPFSQADTSTTRALWRDRARALHLFAFDWHDERTHLAGE